MKIRIYYEDTDAGGIVYHANYFRYCERLRSEMFFSNNLEVCTKNCGFVVRRILNAEFIRPARLGDILEIKAKILSHKKTSFLVLHEIFKNNELIFQTEILVVYLCDGKPSKIPEKMLNFLLEF